MSGWKTTLKKIPLIVPLYKTAWRSFNYWKFLIDFSRFRRMNAAGTPRFPLPWGDRQPCVDDRTAVTSFDRHYVFHTAWAARVVAEIMPSVHVDVSSSLHFCTIISAFVPVRFYDYRPADLRLDNLVSEAGDLLALPFADRSVESLSCMHVVEHVGLGRYGDPLDPNGDLKAIDELKRVLAPGGTLLFVVPVGRPRIMFNAHRIYSFDQIAGYFAGLALEEFALIPDDPALGGLMRNATREMANAQSYGCGCFRFRRMEDGGSQKKIQ